MKQGKPMRASLVLIAAGLLLAPLAAAAHHHHGHHFGPQGFGGRAIGPDGPGPEGGLFRELMAERLDLSDQQRDQIRGLLEAHRDEAEAVREALWSARQALHEAARGPAVDEAAILAAGALLGEKEAEAALHRARTMAEVRSLLTAEQQAELDEMREMRQEFRERRFERHRGR